MVPPNSQVYSTCWSLTGDLSKEQFYSRLKKKEEILHVFMLHSCSCFTISKHHKNLFVVKAYFMHLITILKGERNVKNGRREKANFMFFLCTFCFWVSEHLTAFSAFLVNTFYYTRPITIVSV